MKWHPIETAPKDAAQILTYCLCPNKKEKTYPKPSHNFVGPYPWYQNSFWSDQHNLWVGWPKGVQPTHWMLLPEPPK